MMKWERQERPRGLEKERRVSVWATSLLSPLPSLSCRFFRASPSTTSKGTDNKNGQLEVVIPQYQ